MFKLNSSEYLMVSPFIGEENNYLPLLEDCIMQEKEADIYADSIDKPKRFLHMVWC